MKKAARKVNEPAGYDFAAYSIGIVYASACTCLTNEEAEDRMNSTQPTGISSRWRVSDDKTFSDGKTPNGGPCHDHPATHRHLLFNC